MTGIDRKMKVISSCLGFHHRGRGGHRGEFGLWLTVVTLILMRNPSSIKLKKHKNICYLQPNACNTLVDKQLYRCRYCCR